MHVRALPIGFSFFFFFSRRKWIKVRGKVKLLCRLLHGRRTLLGLQFSLSQWCLIFHRHMSSRNLLRFVCYPVLLPFKHSISYRNCVWRLFLTTLFSVDFSGRDGAGSCRPRCYLGAGLTVSPSRLCSQASILLAPSLQQMCMINGLFTFCCLIIIFSASNLFTFTNLF